MGINLLFLDTDIIIFDDPYKTLKQPPFSEMNLILAGAQRAGTQGHSSSSSLRASLWRVRGVREGREECRRARCKECIESRRWMVVFCEGEDQAEGNDESLMVHCREPE
jgi:hypothetical protein